MRLAKGGGGKSKEFWSTKLMPMISSIKILLALENESFGILREIAGAFGKPLVLYKIGKNSSVLLRLAQKAFSKSYSLFF